jgi:ADP-ribose pyrophosphatase YjhB (NUDIX family)
MSQPPTPARNSHCSWCGAPFTPEQPWPRRCAACQQVSYLNPIPVSVLLQPVTSGGLLVIRRGITPNKGKLALPGGFVDYGETWQEGAAREAHEEMNLRVDPASISTWGVHSAPRGLVLIFGVAPALEEEQLPAFLPNEEVTERLVLRAPRRLAFPLHTLVMDQWFAAQSPEETT